MPRFIKIQPTKIEQLPLLKIALQNRRFNAPSWWSAMLTFPPLPRRPHRRAKQFAIAYPEEVFKKDYERKHPPQFSNFENLDTNKLLYDGYTSRMIPKDNRWMKDPSEIFALKQLDYVYKGYNTKEAYDLTEKEFAKKRVELDIEKEIASRQANLTGLARKSAADLLKEMSFKSGRTKFALQRREQLENFMTKKKIQIKNGIIPALTPADMSPSDSEFYLSYHPHDAAYFNADAYLKYQTGEYAGDSARDVNDPQDEGQFADDVDNLEDFRPESSTESSQQSLIDLFDQSDNDSRTNNRRRNERNDRRR